MQAHAHLHPYPPTRLNPRPPSCTPTSNPLSTRFFLGGGRYAANIALVDAGIGRLVQRLDAFYGHDNRTAYVFTSDHGMNDRGAPPSPVSVSAYARTGLGG